MNLKMYEILRQYWNLIQNQKTSSQNTFWQKKKITWVVTTVYQKTKTFCFYFCVNIYVTSLRYSAYRNWNYCFPIIPKANRKETEHCEKLLMTKRNRLNNKIIITTFTQLWVVRKCENVICK